MSVRVDGSCVPQDLLRPTAHGPVCHCPLVCRELHPYVRGDAPSEPRCRQTMLTTRFGFVAATTSMIYNSQMGAAKVQRLLSVLVSSDNEVKPLPGLPAHKINGRCHLHSKTCEMKNRICSVRPTSAFVDMQKCQGWWLNPLGSRFVVEANVCGPVGSNCFLAASFV